MTKAGYDELVRLRDEREAEVAFRYPFTMQVLAYGLATFGLAKEGTMEFLSAGQAIHIPTAIAEYERAQEVT